METRTVAILSPGDMGAAIGAMLREGGLDVITCLAERGELTRLRAREAGIRDVPDLDALVTEADLILSVLVPAEALPLAERVAASLRRTGATTIYADLNAIAPGTVARIDRLITGAGAPFIDGGIIGGPPKRGSNTRVHVSGPVVEPVVALRECGLDVRVVGPAIGQASGLKMVYAASTKGTTALWTELLVAARALGLDEALLAEFGMSRSGVPQQMMGSIPGMPRRARRWVGEMEEIAATFEELGLTPRILQGAADLYRYIGETTLADQTSREPDPPLDAILETLADRLRSGVAQPNP